MSSKATVTPRSDDYAELCEVLRSCSTTKQLYDAAGTPEFKTRAGELIEDEREQLRDDFVSFLNAVKGRMDMEELAGVTLRVQDCDFPPASPRFPDSKFVVIKGVREDSGEKFECVSSAVRIYRHFSTRPSPPEQRVQFYKESPEQQRARDAKPGTNPMWLIRRMPTEGQARAAVPF